MASSELHQMTDDGDSIGLNQPIDLQDSTVLDQAMDTDDNMEVVTTVELYARLLKAWKHEKLAPVLLDPMEGEINALRAEMEIVQTNLRQVSTTDLRYGVHKMEIKRLHYILVSYLRARIIKIQEYAWYYAKVLGDLKPTDPPIMTSQEVKFLQEYLSATETHLVEVGLKHMPSSCRRFVNDELIHPPSFGKYVIFISKVDTSITIRRRRRGTKIIELKSGEQYTAPYYSIAKLLKEDKILLI